MAGDVSVVVTSAAVVGMVAGSAWGSSGAVAAASPSSATDVVSSSGVAVSASPSAVTDVLSAISACTAPSNSDTSAGALPCPVAFRAGPPALGAVAWRTGRAAGVSAGCLRAPAARFVVLLALAAAHMRTGRERAYGQDKRRLGEGGGARVIRYPSRTYVHTSGRRRRQRYRILNAPKEKKLWYFPSRRR